MNSISVYAHGNKLDSDTGRIYHPLYDGRFSISKIYLTRSNTSSRQFAEFVEFI